MSYMIKEQFKYSAILKTLKERKRAVIICTLISVFVNLLFSVTIIPYSVQNVGYYYSASPLMLFYIYCAYSAIFGFITQKKIKNLLVTNIIYIVPVAVALTYYVILEERDISKIFGIVGFVVCVAVGVLSTVLANSRVLSEFFSPQGEELSFKKTLVERKKATLIALVISFVVYLILTFGGYYLQKLNIINLPSLIQLLCYLYAIIFGAVAMKRIKNIVVTNLIYTVTFILFNYIFTPVIYKLGGSIVLFGTNFEFTNAVDFVSVMLHALGIILYYIVTSGLEYILLCFVSSVIIRTVQNNRHIKKQLENKD